MTSEMPSSQLSVPNSSPPPSATSLWHNWIKVIAVLVSLEVIAAIGFVGYTIGHSGAGANSTITVTSTGSVSAVPDTVEFQIGLHTVRSDELLATEVNNRKVTALENALLRGKFVKKKDLQTSGLAFYQNTNYAGVPNGWAVDDTLDVTMHHVKLAGAAIESAVLAGGSGVVLNGVTFSITNKSSLMGEARSRAMHNAFTKASQLASAGNSSVGAIKRITDQESQYSPVFYGSSYVNAVKAASAGGVPVQPGSQSVSVTVTVIYSLSS